MEYFKYWGKADSKYPGGPRWHPLVYHCLDVAAVGNVWLEQSQALRSRISFALGMNAHDRKLPRILSFFLALHDLGKFDIRFQSKAPEVRNKSWMDLAPVDLACLSPADVSSYNHGKSGYDLYLTRLQMWILVCSPRERE